MAKIIIGIHGLGNKPAEKRLEKWWNDAIIEGLNRAGHEYKKIPFKLVYWADILHPEPETDAIDEKDDALYIREPYTPASKENGKPKKEIFYLNLLKYFRDKLDKIFLRADMTLNFGKVSDSIIHSYFEDLASYYSNEIVTHNNTKYLARRAITERLESILGDYKNYEILLIAHSMGSIICYDVLRSHPIKIKVRTFVTIGSPLGIPFITSRIYIEHKALTVPKNIESAWYNLADKQDLVAMDQTLADDYNSEKSMVKITDIEVYNDYYINKKRNPHKSYGYLRTPEMTGIIHEFLTFKEKPSLVKQYAILRRKFKYVLKRAKKKYASK